MDTPTITPVDAFDAAVTAESTYVAPHPSAPVDDAAAILETPAAAPPARGAAGKFAVAAPAEDTADAEAPVAEEKPAGKTPRHDPQARIEQTITQRATSFSYQFAKAREADPAIESRINRDLLTVRPFSTLTAQDQAAIRAIPNPAERDRVAFLCFLADQWIDSDHAVAL